MIKFGLCCWTGGLCCALLGGALVARRGDTTVLGQAALEIVAEKTVGCTPRPAAPGRVATRTCDRPVRTVRDADSPGDDVEDVELTAEESMVVTYVADLIEDGKAPDRSPARSSKRSSTSRRKRSSSWTNRRCAQV